MPGDITLPGIFYFIQNPAYQQLKTGHQPLRPKPYAKGYLLRYETMPFALQEVTY